MTLRKRAGIILCTTVATAAVVGLGVAPALASTPSYTVKVGGGGSYSAVASKTVLSDNGVSVTCTSKGRTHASTASGKINSGTHKGRSPVKVGTAAKLAFNRCSGPLGAVRTVVQKTPYAVTVDSKTNRKGETDGIISGVKVAVSMTGCSFTVTGTTNGYYTNSKHTLTMTTTGKLPIKPANKAALTISGVKGCAGLVRNGNHPTYVSTYVLNRKVTIKSS